MTHIARRASLAAERAGVAEILEAAARAAALGRAGFAVREDAGRGLRRVVPSLEPRAIVDVEVVAKLLELGVVVIAAGGGAGTPWC